MAGFGSVYSAMLFIQRRVVITFMERACLEGVEHAIIGAHVNGDSPAFPKCIVLRVADIAVVEGCKISWAFPTTVGVE